MYIGDWQSRYMVLLCFSQATHALHGKQLATGGLEEASSCTDNPEVRKQFAISIFEIQDAPWG